LLCEQALGFGVRHGEGAPARGREQPGEKDRFRVCGQVDAVVAGSVGVGGGVVPELVEALLPALVEVG
jgi:hypothetical protein